MNPLRCTLAALILVCAAVPSLAQARGFQARQAPGWQRAPAPVRVCAPAPVRVCAPKPAHLCAPAWRPPVRLELELERVRVAPNYYVSQMQANRQLLAQPQRFQQVPTQFCVVCGCRHPLGRHLRSYGY